ncbi:type IV pilus assembly protein PilM [Defluviitalea saccharophila]|uniref:Chaperone protein DnaK n=1 Tax=Defluviitalea saccharophila TaxID=879970 RepID=A0ABZ2Y7B8_9FIRM
MKNITLDIGSQNIRIVEGRGFGKVFTINNLCSIQTPLTVYEDGMLYDINTLANHLKDAMKQHNIKGSYISYIIEGSSILSREIEVPSIKKNELSSMIRYEMENNLPNPVDYYILQFKVTDKFIGEGINRLKILVSAVPKHIVESYIELSKRLDLEPYILNVKHDSVINLFKKQCEENKEIIFLLLDMGHSSIDAMIFEKCRYRYKRRIDFGGKNISEDIAAFYHLPMAEAEKRKKESAQINLENTDENTIESITRKHVDEWIEEINKIILYFTRTNEGHSIHKIWLYGGSSKIPNISEYISVKTGIPTSLVYDIVSTNLIKMNIRKTEIEFKDLYTDYTNALSGCIRNRVMP